LRIDKGESSLWRSRIAALLGNWLFESWCLCGYASPAPVVFICGSARSKKTLLLERQDSAIEIAALLGICFLSLGALVAINPRLRWFLSAVLCEVKKSSFWRGRSTENQSLFR